MRTLSLAFQAIFHCEHCDTDLYAGWMSSLRCHVCARHFSLQAFWKEFSLADMSQTFGAPPDKVFERKSYDGGLFYQAAAPICQSCKSPIELSTIDASARAGWLSCAKCQKKISVRSLERQAQDEPPWARW